MDAGKSIDEGKEADQDWYIRLRGLPQTATEDEIAEFLVDCEIVGNVVILKNEAGRQIGDAVVKLLTKNDIEKALECNKKCIHGRSVVVEETDNETYNRHVRKVKRMDTEENTFIRLRGLVWNATEEDIKEFLKDCTLKEVVLTTNGRGKPSGDAFVHLDNEADVDKAIAHNKEYIRERFVIVEEIFESQYITETQKVQKKRTIAPGNKEQVEKNMMSNKIDSETDKCEQDERAHGTNFYIMLRGLPWKATEDEIGIFLVDCEIVGNVIIINNEAGKPSGDAVVKLLNEIDLERALKCNRKSLLERSVVVEETDKDTYSRHIRKLDKMDTEENTFIRLRGLVWSATEEDIKTFLHDCDVKEVVITTNDRERPTGDAFVHLDNEADVEKAMAHNREYLRERFVLIEEIYESQYIRETSDKSKKDEKNIAKPGMEAEKGEQDKKGPGNNFYIILRGLPEEATEDEIGSFLVDCEIVGNIYRITNEAGRSSGDAVAKLLNKINLERALQCNRKCLMERSVFVAETDMETYNKHIIKVEKMDTEENTFIRLRGLVWSATEKDIKTFLHDCNVKEVFLTSNERGKPSGDAFVHLDSEADVDRAMAHDKEHLRERFVIVEEIYESQYKRETQGAFQPNQIKNKDCCDSHLRLSNLPLISSELDIQTFLKDCKIKEVRILKNRAGKPNGEAIVEMESDDDLVRGLICNNSSLGGRFISVDKVEKCELDTSVENIRNLSTDKPDDVENKVRNTNTEIEAGKPGTCYIKLRGLPWKATKDEIAEFLVDCEFVGNVIIIKNEAGKPSGDAVVKLLNKLDLERALKCNRKYLLERSVVVEETDKDTYNQHIIKLDKMDTEENTFIRLRGLVWSATEEDIKTFLHDCNVKEVVITTNDRGKPSGDAFVHLDTELDVEKAVAHNREYLRERFVLIEEIYESQYQRETKGFVSLTSNVVKKSETESEFNLGNKKDNIDNSVDHMESNDKEEYGNDNLSNVKKAYFKFEIRLFGNGTQRDVLKHCKAIEIDGVTWDNGMKEEDSDNNSKIILGCTVANPSIDAEIIMEKLTHLKCVENVIVM